MAKKTISRRRKKTKKTNHLLIFVMVIVILAAISLSVSYFILQDDSLKDFSPFENTSTERTEDAEASTPAITPDPVAVDKPTLLDGTWVSNYDGNIMTISGLSFTLESPSVSDASKLSGSLSIEKSIVTFTYTSGTKTCLQIEGHYQFLLEGRDEVFFELIKDNCSKRKDRMSQSWFKL